MDFYDDPQFKKEFWEWFDRLPVEQRKKFMYYPADMAELNFFNTVYRHKRPPEVSS